MICVWLFSLIGSPMDITAHPNQNVCSQSFYMPWRDVKVTTGKFCYPCVICGRFTHILTGVSELSEGLLHPKILP